MSDDELILKLVNGWFASGSNELDLGLWMTLTTPVLEHIAGLLSQATYVTSISFSGLTIQDISPLAAVLPKLTSLERLGFNNCNLTHVAPLMLNLFSAPKLTELDVNVYKLAPFEREWLMVHANGLPNREFVYDHYLRCAPEHFEDVLTRCGSSIRVLKSAEHTALPSSLLQLTQLAGIVLYNKPLPPSDFQVLSALLHTNRETLTQLSLSAIHLRPVVTELADLIRQCTQLSDVTLYKNGFQDEESECLFAQLATLPLTKFMYSWNKIGPSSAQTLYGAFSNWRELKYLNLIRCDLRSEDVQLLSYTLPQLSCLYTLYLRNNHLSGEAVAAVLQQFPQLPHLSHWMLSDASLPVWYFMETHFSMKGSDLLLQEAPFGFEHCLYALHTFSHLRYIRLDHLYRCDIVPIITFLEHLAERLLRIQICELTLEQLESLLVLLPKMAALQDVHLSCDDMDAVGSDLVQALRTLPDLAKLTLNLDTHFGAVPGEVLVPWLKVATALTTLSLPPDTLTALAAGLQDVVPSIHACMPISFLLQQNITRNLPLEHWATPSEKANTNVY